MSEKVIVSFPSYTTLDRVGLTCAKGKNGRNSMGMHTFEGAVNNRSAREVRRGLLDADLGSVGGERHDC
jgi:hypothetical protein